jgi:phospholipid/cholesterol/gamma-HCH transport system permease protein
MSYAEARVRVNSLINAAIFGFFQFFSDFAKDVGAVYVFAVQSTRLFFVRPFRFSELMIHMDFIGNKSLAIIGLSGVFTGMALAYQIFLGFKIVNAASLVGPTVGLGITRELGPVLTGLIVSARAGGAMAARLGTMRVTEQIDALEVMGVEPVQYLVSPRVIAAMLVMPLLTGVFDFVAMLGAYWVCTGLFEIDSAEFLDRTLNYIKPFHIYEGLFKAAIFGFFFGVICCHRGFNTKGGAEGVGSSTNRGVVASMLMIIILDFFLTNLINVFYLYQAAFLK